MKGSDGTKIFRNFNYLCKSCKISYYHTLGLSNINCMQNWKRNKHESLKTQNIKSKLKLACA